MSISEELKRKAIELGLCKEWTEAWKNPDLDSLCEMFISGIDFCIKNDYPTCEYIKKNFGEIAENHGIYVDTQVSVTNPDTAILLGTAKGYIELTGYVTRDIYVRHDCEAEIYLTDNSMAFIRVFDNSKVKVINNSQNKAFIYKYIDGYNGNIESDGDVRVRIKNFSDL